MMDFLGKMEPATSMGTRLQRLGAMALVAEIGWNGFRSYWDELPRGYQRLKKELESLPEAHTSALLDIEAIDATLRAFEPVKMEAHLSKMPPSVKAAGRK